MPGDFDYFPELKSIKACVTPMTEQKVYAVFEKKKRKMKFKGIGGFSAEEKEKLIKKNKNLIFSSIF